jgi:diguanylate cyclase (GGDEF)-like protein
MDSIPHLREPLIEAKIRGDNIASKPFMLVEGEDAYVMFRRVDRSESQGALRPEYIFTGLLTAVLVMKTGALLPSMHAPMTDHRLQITRKGEPIEPPLYNVPAKQPPTDLERRIFPTLRLQSNDYGTSQRMQLTVERPIRFADLDATGLTVMTVFALLSLGLLVTYLHGHSGNVEKALALEQKAEYLALHDPLTGLSNRHLLHDRVGQALAAWRRHGVGFALVFVDINKFKQINDRNGHAVGDQLLCAMSARLTDAVREIDTVARYGGDEFIVLVSAVSSEDDLETVRGKIQSVMARPFELDGSTLSVTASLGVSRCPQDGEDFQALLRHADKEMYGMKHDPGVMAQ